MAHVVIVRETVAPYQHHMVCVASTWENAKRLAEAYAHGTIAWKEQTEFGVVTGYVDGDSTKRKFQLSSWKINTKSDEFPTDY